MLGSCANMIIDMVDGMLRCNEKDCLVANNVPFLYLSSSLISRLMTPPCFVSQDHDLMSLALQSHTGVTHGSAQ